MSSLVPCPRCGSAACMAAGTDVCRHTRLPRYGEPNKGFVGPPEDKMVRAAPAQKRNRRSSRKARKE